MSLLPKNGGYDCTVKTLLCENNAWNYTNKHCNQKCILWMCVGTRLDWQCVEHKLECGQIQHIECDILPVLNDPMMS